MKMLLRTWINPVFAALLLDEKGEPRRMFPEPSAAELAGRAAIFASAASFAIAVVWVLFIRLRYRRKAPPLPYTFRVLVGAGVGLLVLGIAGISLG